jgi:hypothetical protein
MSEMSPEESRGQLPADARRGEEHDRDTSVLPSYVALARFTDQGRKNRKDSPKRLDQAKAVAAKMGVLI